MKNGGEEEIKGEPEGEKAIATILKDINTNGGTRGKTNKLHGLDAITMEENVP